MLGRGMRGYRDNGSGTESRLTSKEPGYLKTVLLAFEGNIHQHPLNCRIFRNNVSNRIAAHRDSQIEHIVKQGAHHRLGVRIVLDQKSPWKARLRIGHRMDRLSVPGFALG